MENFCAGLKREKLDITALSGICGSISIACWLVVFSPQIIENFRRGSADGLSVRFVSIWLLGDVCNVLGAVLQGVLPTMIILAVYYACSDIVLLSQCFYYRGFTWQDSIIPPYPTTIMATATAVADSNSSTSSTSNNGNNLAPDSELNETSSLLIPSSLERISPAHLSPTVPLLSNRNKLSDLHSKSNSDSAAVSTSDNKDRTIIVKNTLLCTVLLNFGAILIVVFCGIISWYLTASTPASSPPQQPKFTFSIPGQVFGYFCATLYLSSRLPQLLLNYRRKSTDGVSMLFFMFACVGNLTYVLSILFFDSQGDWATYWIYLSVNASWLAGSAGTSLLDLVIFVQFWIYRNGLRDGRDMGRKPVTREDQRPLLERGLSSF